MGIDWRDILDAAVKVIGFFLTIIASGGVMFFVHRALTQLLGRLVKDEAIARAGTTLALILLGLKAVTAALRYVTQPELAYLHTGLMGLLDDMASIVQWVAGIVVLLFIGYALSGWRGPGEEA